MALKYDQDTQDVSLMAYDQYLRWVHWTPPLTDEEEAQLIERIEQGKVEQIKPSPDQRILQQAQQAQDRLVAGFQQLVIHIARAYHRRFRSMEMMDLIQEGNIGLLNAIAAHRPGKGHFTGLASCCIRQAIWMARYESDRMIRVPQKVRVALSKLAKVQQQLSRTLERESTAVELAEAMQVSEGRVVALLGWQEQVEVESLHALLFDEEAEDKYQFVNLFAPTIEEATPQREHEAAVQQALQVVLSERQRAVVQARYGFDQESKQVRTCVEVGERLGLSFGMVARYDRQARELLCQALAPLVLGTQEEVA